LKIKDVRAAVVGVNCDWTVTRISTEEKVTGFGERFLVAVLLQGEICHGC
jgi:L-alanine-DL-glutamate epimerase-like enolase superfamily enzyme